MVHSGAELPSGIRPDCVTEAADDAALMLFVHGFSEFWYAWKSQLDEFGNY